MNWFFLFLAIIFEVAGTTSMKLSDGFTKLTPSIFMFVFYLFCFGALNLALKKIDVSVAYAIWSGFGTALIAVIGIVAFHESASHLKFGSIALIILGVIGLNMSGISH